MKLRIFCFLIMAFGLVPLAANAAQITTSIILTDLNGDPLPPSGAHTYQLVPGQQFKVQVQGVVNNPNITDTIRAGTAMDSKPLGVANLAGTLTTNGVNVANPIGSVEAVPKWENFVEYIGLGVPGFVNLLDQGSDGDLDPSGAGVANSSTSLSNAIFLSTFQLGANGLTPFFEGDYVYLGGVTQILFTPTTAQVFFDPAGGTTGLSVESVLDTFVTIPITIGIPEPSTFALAGLGLVGLVVAMRRKAT
jgi:hypothetical protein